MSTISSTSKPAYVYDSGTDTWIPIGPGEHSHEYISNSLTTTAGDIIYASSANTPARLGIGSTSQVLSVSNGLPAWTTPGGATLLSTTTLSGASTTVSISSQSYRDLLVIISGVTNATATGSFRIAPNGTTNITHTQAQFFAQASNPTTDSYLFVTDDSQKMLYSNADNVFSLTISQYSSTTIAKPFISSGYYYNTGMGTLGASSTSGAIATTTAISSLVFSNTGGSFTAGTVKIYGVK